MRTIQQIKSDFEQILSEVVKINGISVESAVQVATVILQEAGKYNRCPEINENNGNGSGFQPATDNQKQAMKNLKLVYTENISKSDASKQIEQAVARLQSNRKGGFRPSPF
jgi:hypothetical protein